MNPDRSMRRGLRKLAHNIEGMLALGGVEIVDGEV